MKGFAIQPKINNAQGLDFDKDDTIVFHTISLKSDSNVDYPVLLPETDFYFIKEEIVALMIADNTVPQKPTHFSDIVILVNFILLLNLFKTCTRL